MDHRVRVASIGFWSLFFINALIVTYLIIQYITRSEIFGDVPLVFVAAVNAIVCLVAAIGMSVQESYRI